MFGAACRHEFPLLFFNLKHGERSVCKHRSLLCIIVININLKNCRLSYAVFMLDKVLEKFTSAKLYIMYDIACSLQRHLEVCSCTSIIVV